jgi:hypothetical protein
MCDLLWSDPDGEFDTASSSSELEQGLTKQIYKAGECHPEEPDSCSGQT